MLESISYTLLQDAVFCIIYTEKILDMTTQFIDSTALNQQPSTLKMKLNILLIITKLSQFGKDNAFYHLGVSVNSRESWYPH